MNIPALEVEQVSRRYGEFEALKPATFTLGAGEVIALNGPNGSGKSTLLLCLSGLLRPSSGRVRVDGRDLYVEEPEARRRLAYVPDVPVFYQELTAWEHLQFIAAAHDAMQDFHRRAEGLLRDFGLWEARDLFPHAYSRGMRMKLGLALAFVRPFRVLLLDEPDAALDVESTAQLANRLARARQDGAAVLLSTHDEPFGQSIGARIWQMREGCLHVA